MTKREMFVAIVNGAITDEVIETAKAELEKMDSANSAKNSAAARKRAEANAPLIAACVGILADAESPLMASEIAAALDVTTSKATVIAKAVEGVVIGETKVKGRVVKTYSLK